MSVPDYGNATISWRSNVNVRGDRLPLYLILASRVLSPFSGQAAYLGDTIFKLFKCCIARTGSVLWDTDEQLERYIADRPTFTGGRPYYFWFL